MTGRIPRPPRHRMRRLTTTLALAAAMLLALIAAGCGSGASQDDFDDLRTQVAALQTRVQAAEDAAERALLFSVLPALEVAKFHDIYESINDDGVIPTTAPGIAQRALDVIRTTAWPTELADNVAQWDDALVDLLDPLLNDDATAAARPAVIVHAISHAFGEAVSAFIGGEAVPAPPDLGEEHDHEIEEDADHDEDADLDAE